MDLFTSPRTIGHGNAQFLADLQEPGIEVRRATSSLQFAGYRINQRGGSMSRRQLNP